MSQALLLQDQLAAAEAQAQAQAATLQQVLDSERASAACEQLQLEAKRRLLEAERHVLEPDLEAARTVGVEQCAAAGAAQRQAEADAEAVRAELGSFTAQVHTASCFLLSAGARGGCIQHGQCTDLPC